MRKIVWTTNRRRNLATAARSRFQSGSGLSTFEQQAIAIQKAAREMTPEQRQKKLADAETLRFLGLQP
jgi:hypothetical protein